MVKRLGCCGVPWWAATILLLSLNIILNCSAVLFSLLHYKEALKNHLFSDEVELCMIYIFLLYEVIVFFNAIISAFKGKSSMLTFAIVMLLLESFFIILAAIRIYYRGILTEFWHNVLKPEVAQHLPVETMDEFFKSERDSVPLTLTIAFGSVFLFISFMKICCAMVVNSYKNWAEMIRTENTFYRMKTCRDHSISRPTSYIYSTMTPENDKHLYE